MHLEASQIGRLSGAALKLPPPNCLINFCGLFATSDQNHRLLLQERRKIKDDGSEQAFAASAWVLGSSACRPSKGRKCGGLGEWEVGGGDSWGAL